MENAVDDKPAFETETFDLDEMKEIIFSIGVSKDVENAIMKELTFENVFSLDRDAKTLGRDIINNFKASIRRPKEPGVITTIAATMFGGKSVYALHLMESRSNAYQRLNPNAKKVLYINHFLDDRVNPLTGSTGPFSTHSNIISPAALDRIGVNYTKEKTLADIPDDYILQHNVIFIDEAQFFPDLKDRVLYISEVLGVDVYAMGLTVDYKREIFGQLGYLSLIADESITLRSTFCGFCASRGIMRKAISTHRISDVSGAQIEIGSKNYVAVCRKCYIEHNKK